MIELLDFQCEDVEKLVKQDNVLIASEMGTGKTVVAIELDKHRREQNTFSSAPDLTLVVAPLSTHEAWRWHFANMQPDLKLHVIDSKNKTTRERIYTSTYDVAIVHWEALRLLPGLAKVKWLHIIADECQRMQNRTAQQTTAIKALKTIYKTALSGTPVTTSPDKFWSTLNWLYKKDFSSYWRFFGKYIKFVVTPEGYRKIEGVRLENIPQLHKTIEPFYVRHMKKKPCCAHHPNGVQPQLPDKYYAQPLWVDLTPQQRRIYDQMRKDSLAWVGEHEDQLIAAPVAVAKLIRLQQFSLAHAEVLPDGSVRLSEPSSKLDAVMNLIRDTDEPLVVFSQFKQLVNLLNARLRSAGLDFVTITGDVPASLRGAAIDRFQQGKARIFTGTIAAGGVGITLTAASLAAFTDRSWSPALNAQAEDRLWRIGQANAVEIIDVLARDTVDLGRQQRLVARAEWLRALLDPTKKFQQRFLENPLDELDGDQ